MYKARFNNLQIILFNNSNPIIKIKKPREIPTLKTISR
ncbi:hypothetical protein J2W57_001785 [Chryseobacterium ginsenosidimutans]|uniref:Uncharacterized protein n=1 Tax=Chryseobacterium geocarposphaerae TaxID=1416776 RepID=A0ABU1LBG6_9FLAO|nr:hypothetical protein [Chryseobacterium geocarposphaerae]MDR6698413.1 hypothetical protein [Chryseobacterium ginsenosidimutans]